MAYSWVTALSFVCVFFAQPVPTFTWDTDLELFDLVEEIPQNFYEFLSVEQDASSADIRKAYRRLSLTLHPDKNKDENAETQFRQLVAIYEVLKDEERRQRYNDILVNGLPDWKQPVFYYRRVRKMSNSELGFLLFLILTVGHYAVIWSIYLEKQLDELLSKKKREKRKKTSIKSPDELKAVAQDKKERSLEKPHWQDILPLKMGIWLYLSVKSLPYLIQDVKQYYEDYRELKIKEKEEAQALAKQETQQSTSVDRRGPQSADSLHGQIPGGTPGRWEKIAHELCRSVTDVTSKVKQVKDNVTNTSGMVKLSELRGSAQSVKGLKVGALPDSLITQREEESFEDTAGGEEGEGRARRRRANKSAGEEREREKAKGRRQRDFDPTTVDEDSGDEVERKPARELWTQNQQRLLELALQQYPRGTPERWDMIAKVVPGKSKEECMIRYKLLAELVQKKKQAKS